MLLTIYCQTFIWIQTNGYLRVLPYRQTPKYAEGVVYVQTAASGSNNRYLPFWAIRLRSRKVYTQFVSIVDMQIDASQYQER
jgi:hypothetical protein